jgi:ribosomal protein S18 acetylase RimI-like enzyme
LLNSTYIKTQIGELVIRRAGDEDKSLVLHLKQEAASWLESKGIHQWAGILMAKGEDMVYKRVHEGEVYLALKGAQAVGTVSILWEDHISWGEKGKDGKAGYMHGLAILPKYHHKGVGKEILEWAMDYIRSKGKLIRLDCMAENPRINKYYKDLKFDHAGVTELPSGFKVSLYEKS